VKRRPTGKIPLARKGGTPSSWPRPPHAGRAELAGGEWGASLVNGAFLFDHKGSPTEFKACFEAAISRGWLVLHESGTYVKFTPGRRRAVRLIRTNGAPPALSSGFGVGFPVVRKAGRAMSPRTSPRRSAGAATCRRRTCRQPFRTSLNATNAAAAGSWP
jgi:hypothetical protein